jgi:TonB family protein
VVLNKAGVVLVVVCALATCLYARPRADDAKHDVQTKDVKEQIYDIGGDVESPKLIHVVEPEFNPKSEEAFVSGTIKLQIVVTKEGSVKDPKVLAGPNQRQDKAAIDAVMKWRFRPGLKKGEPVNVRATVEVNFHLL